MFVSSPGWTFRSLDVKDAYRPVPQKEELYVRVDHACYQVLKCLPETACRQAEAKAKETMQLRKVAKAVWLQGLLDKAACGNFIVVSYFKRRQRRTF